jgi:hypothetical protein
MLTLIAIMALSQFNPDCAAAPPGHKGLCWQPHHQLVVAQAGPVVDNLNGVPSPAPSATAAPVPSPAPAAADAPLKQGAHACGTVEKDLDAPGCHVILNVGMRVPYAGVLLDEQEDVHRTRRESRSETKVKDYETGNFIMPVAAYLGITGGAIAVALAVLSAVLAVTGHLK